MLGRGKPCLHRSAKFFCRHACVGDRQDLHQAIEVFAFQKLCKIAVQGGLHHGV
jgi:hypothetical protein